MIINIFLSVDMILQQFLQLYNVWIILDKNNAEE